MTVVWIVIASVAFVLVLLVGIGIAARLTFAAIAGPLNERIAASVPTSDVVRKDLRANNIGIESKGKKHPTFNELACVVADLDRGRIFDGIRASEYSSWDRSPLSCAARAYRRECGWDAAPGQRWHVDSRREHHQHDDGRPRAVADGQPRWLRRRA